MRIFLVLLLSLASLSAAEWETLRGCKFIANEYNDGDSFHVESGGEEFIFRLYFVDTTESEGSLPERVAEQAAHFGITPERSIEIGRYAKAATAQMLSRPFTVTTRYQNAMGRSNLPRYYAFITTADKKDLGEVLISSGLARAFGMAAAPPSQNVADLRARYDSLQTTARRQKLGAWGSGPAIRRDTESASTPLSNINSSQTATPQATHPHVGVSDSVAAEILDDLDPLRRMPLSTTPTTSISSTNYSEIPGWKPKPESTAPAPAKDESGKISLNTASPAELEALPGIGPEIAARIIAARPLETVDDLKSVKGIGPKKFADVAPLVVP